MSNAPPVTSTVFLLLLTLPSIVGCAGPATNASPTARTTHPASSPAVADPAPEFTYRRGTQPLITQPDPALWAQVREDAEWKDVLALLGPPMSQSPDDPQCTHLWFEFGRITYQTPEMCGLESFLVFVDRQNRVSEKSDPFGGASSLDGRPLPPALLSPTAGQVLSHYPRLVDLRWHPSAGQYPLLYEVEVELSQQVQVNDGPTTLEWLPAALPRDGHAPPVFIVEEPYLPQAMPGCQGYRWRVRAKNTVGTSDWTPWRQFEFTQ